MCYKKAKCNYPVIVVLLKKNINHDLQQSLTVYFFVTKISETLNFYLFLWTRGKYFNRCTIKTIKKNIVFNKQTSHSQTLIVHDLRAMWTTETRDVAYGLYDSYEKANVLRHNLDTNILRKIGFEGGVWVLIGSMYVELKKHTSMKVHSLFG